MAAQAILFVHGNLSRGSHWAPQTRALQAEGFRCYAPDLRGFGFPPAPGLPSSLLAMADDVASLCAAQGVERACVVGLSMGGLVAQAVAIRHPELIHSLLLVGTYRADELHPTIAAFNAGASKGAPAIETMAPMARASFSERYQAAHPDVVERFIAEMLATPQASLEATIKALGDFPAVRAPEIKAPTLVIGGSLDVLCPPDVSRHLAQAIPGARYMELEAGHMMNIEAPDELTEQVRELASR